MKYSGTRWESSYNHAFTLFLNAHYYENYYAKAKTLKEAWNATYGLPFDYVGRDELLRDIEDYADDCGIDLDEVSGY